MRYYTLGHPWCVMMATRSSSDGVCVFRTIRALGPIRVTGPNLESDCQIDVRGLVSTITWVLRWWRITI